MMMAFLMRNFGVEVSIFWTWTWDGDVDVNVSDNRGMFEVRSLQ